jgi:uncharacterized protein (DUF488 family)
MSTQPERVIYSIGHSNKSFEAFADLLTQHEIEVVADVRSQPYSRYAVHFSAAPLKAALEVAGFKYVFLGSQIGGKPKDTSLYDEEGYVRYDVIAESEAFRAGIERLLVGIEKYRVAIMCGEENPTGCHRRNLIAPALREHSVEILHIRANGELQTEEDLQRLNREIDMPPDAVQLSLFG